MQHSSWTTMSYPYAYREKKVADVHWEKRQQTRTWVPGDFPVLNSNFFLNSCLWVLQFPSASLSSLKRVCGVLLPFNRPGIWVFQSQPLGVHISECPLLPVKYGRDLLSSDRSSFHHCVFHFPGYAFFLCFLSCYWHSPCQLLLGH